MFDPSSAHRRRPRILILVGSLLAGGKERQIIELLKGIKQKNLFQTSLVVARSGGDREAEAVQWADSYTTIRRFSQFDLITPYLSLLNLIKRENVQIVHTFGSAVWDLVGVLAARQLKLPVIHGGIRSAPLRLGVGHKISKWSAARANAIVANSSAGLEAFGLANHPRSRVIYNGIDLNRFENIESGENERFTLCMVANFSHKKDHATLIQALPEIKEKYPETTLCLVGRDAGTLDMNVRLVNELGLSNSVHFVTNTSHPEPYIKGSQVCILTTYTEGLSNSILEYMALSRPVVATAGSGNNELVVPGETGYLVPRSSHKEVADRVIHLLRNPQLACEMGKAGRQRVIKYFSIERMVSQFEELYESLLAN